MTSWEEATHLEKKLDGGWDERHLGASFEMLTLVYQGGTHNEESLKSDRVVSYNFKVREQDGGVVVHMRKYDVGGGHIHPYGHKGLEDCVSGENKWYRR